MSGVLLFIFDYYKVCARKVQKIMGLPRHWKYHIKSDLRSDQDHHLKKNLRSDQDQRSFFASKVPYSRVIFVLIFKDNNNDNDINWRTPAELPEQSYQIKIRSLKKLSK
jgi:hypothetical protein